MGTVHWQCCDLGDVNIEDADFGHNCTLGMHDHNSPTTRLHSGSYFLSAFVPTDGSVSR